MLRHFHLRTRKTLLRPMIDRCACAADMASCKLQLRFQAGTCAWRVTEAFQAFVRKHLSEAMMLALCIACRLVDLCALMSDARLQLRSPRARVAMPCTRGTYGPAEYIPCELPPLALIRMNPVIPHTYLTGARRDHVVVSGGLPVVFLYTGRL